MPMSIFHYLLFCSLMLLGSSVIADGVPEECNQLILGIAPTWNSMRGDVRLFERSRSGDWSPVAGPFPVLFGKNGVAWGTGLAGQNEPGLRKKERDGRAPAGVFEVGEVFGYDSNLPPGADYPYHQVTEADVWSDDSRSPNYNRHIVIDPKNPPDNYTHEKMRSGDFAYHWLVEIRHNSDPPVPGAGSAIFFHIRLGVTPGTTGFPARQKSDHENVQRFALCRKRRIAQGRSQIQAQRPWPRPQAPHKIDIAPSPALRIFFAPDFPTFHESGRKISWPGFDPIIDNR